MGEPSHMAACFVMTSCGHDELQQELRSIQGIVFYFIWAVALLTALWHLAQLHPTKVRVPAWGLLKILFPSFLLILLFYIFYFIYQPGRWKNNCVVSSVLIIYFSFCDFQIAKLRLQLQRSKQGGGRQCKDSKECLSPLHCCTSTTITSTTISTASQAPVRIRSHTYCNISVFS